jgi:hypothetical protein
MAAPTISGQNKAKAIEEVLSGVVLAIKAKIKIAEYIEVLEELEKKVGEKVNNEIEKIKEEMKKIHEKEEKTEEDEEKLQELDDKEFVAASALVNIVEYKRMLTVTLEQLDEYIEEKIENLSVEELEEFTENVVYVIAEELEKDFYDRTEDEELKDLLNSVANVFGGDVSVMLNYYTTWRLKEWGYIKD